MNAVAIYTDTVRTIRLHWDRKTVVTFTRTESGVTRFLTTIDPLEKRLESSLQSSESTTSDPYRDRVPLRVGGSKLGQLFLLVDARDRDLLLAPRISPFLESGVVKLLAGGKPGGQYSLLLFRRSQRVSESADHYFSQISACVVKCLRPSLRPRRPGPPASPRWRPRAQLRPPRTPRSSCRPGSRSASRPTLCPPDRGPGLGEGPPP